MAVHLFGEHGYARNGAERLVEIREFELASRDGVAALNLASVGRLP